MADDKTLEKDFLDRAIVASLIEEHRRTRKALERKVDEAGKTVAEIKQLLKENSLAEKILSELDE